jgi:hypothetical protein
MTHADQARSTGGAGASSNLKQDAESAVGRAGATMARAKEEISQSAASAGDALHEDLRKLADDVASLKDTVTKLAKSVGGEVADAAGEIGADFVHVVKDEASSIATEFEKMARKNPIAVVAGALAVGLFIGLMRGRG